MKKWIIGSFVGAIIVFLWQFLSWGVIGLHEGSMKYTPAQDQVISILNANLTEEGMYFLPTVKPDATYEEKEASMEQLEGKPWAWVVFGKSFTINMPVQMTKGFIIDLILVILLISILTRGGLLSFVGIVTGSMAVGVFSFLWTHYTMSNWYNVPWASIQGHLIDAIVAWGLCGLWLGWWLRRS